MPKPSSGAEIGRLLVLIDIIIGILLLIAMASLFASIEKLSIVGPIPGLTYSLLTFYAVADAMGLILAVWGIKEASAGDFRRGWIYSLVASFLPPFRIIMFIGAILMMVSPEGKWSLPKPKRPEKKVKKPAAKRRIAKPKRKK